MLGKLNEKQLDFVTSRSRETMVIAGPGTGKTKSLVSRIEFLVKQGFSPREILAITFTRKAVEEIEGRLTSSEMGVQVHTFHSFGKYLLEKSKKEVNLVSRDERDDLIRTSLKNTGFLNLSLKEAGYLISFNKSKSQTGEEIQDPRVAKLVFAYNKVLQSRNYLDFDDLLLAGLKLVKDGRFSGDQFQSILVDEFQDVNVIQYEMIKSLARPSQNFSVIGDPNQSIYTFRGATPEVFTQFLKDFPNAKVIDFDINYRSALRILNTSSLLFPGVRLEAFHKKGGNVSLIRTINEFSEADFVVDFITRKMGGTDLVSASNVGIDTNYRFSDFAVIYRTHGLARLLTKKFATSGIPYQMVGQESLYENQKVRFLIDQMKVQEESGNQPKKLSHFLERLVVKLNLDSENVFQFIGNMVRFDCDKDGLTKALAYLESLKDRDYYDSSAVKVTLLTMHAAKGLEFPIVFVCGFEDGLIPYLKKGADKFRLQEERRLLYVAMTRAREELFLIFTDYRKAKKQKPSRFLQEISGKGLEQIVDQKAYQRKERRKVRRLKQSQTKMF